MGIEPALLGIIGGAIVLGGAAFAWYFSEPQKVRRQLRSARVRPIGEVRDDELAKVVGRARPFGESLSAPLTGRPCVYFVAIVEERRKHRDSHHWRTIAREERCVPFVLEDDTGRAIVEATAARVAIDVDSHSTSGVLEDPTDAQRAFLARHGESAAGVFFNRRLRYQEAVIADGEIVAVLGAGTREPDPDAPPADGYRGAAPTRLRLTSSRKYPLVISDDPRTTG